MTGVKLEKMSDIDKYLFIEKGLRGGISYIAKRYAKTNNKYMSDYDPNKPSTFSTCLDKNNLNNFIKNNFNAKLLFTDTDSLTYEIKSENVYEEFYTWKDLFEFSNYSKDSKFFDDTNKKVIGKMKDEYGGVIIGLKSKMYSIKK